MAKKERVSAEGRPTGGGAVMKKKGVYEGIGRENRYLATQQKVNFDDGWKLPGRGEPGEGCGELVRYVCPNCGHVEVVEHRCMKRECPVCGPLWVRREAVCMKKRLERAKAVLGGRLHHVVISPPCDVVIKSDNDVKVWRRRVYRVLRDAGARGGVVVIHPYRDDGGDFSRVGLHFHCLVLGDWIERGDVVFRREKLVLKRVGPLKYFKQYYYVLEHAGVRDGLHGITWFGDVAYNNFPASEDERIVGGGGKKVICPRCGAEMVREYIYDWVSRDLVRFVYVDDYG